MTKKTIRLFQNAVGEEFLRQGILNSPLVAINNLVTTKIRNKHYFVVPCSCPLKSPKCYREHNLAHMSLLLDTCLYFLHDSKWNDCSSTPTTFCFFSIDGNLGWLHWLGDPNSTIISELSLPPHHLVFNRSLKLLSALENIMRQLLGYCKFGTQHLPKSRAVKEALKDLTGVGISQSNGIGNTNRKLWSLSRILKTTMLILDRRTPSSSQCIWISIAQVTTSNGSGMETEYTAKVLAVCNNLLIFRLHFFGIRLSLFFHLDTPHASLMFTTRYMEQMPVLSAFLLLV